MIVGKYFFTALTARGCFLGWALDKCAARWLLVEARVTSLVHISPEGDPRSVAWLRLFLVSVHLVILMLIRPMIPSLMTLPWPKGGILSSWHLVARTKWSPPSRVSLFQITFVRGSEGAE